MYAQNLGAKNFAMMQKGMSDWVKQGQMTQQKAATTLAADAAWLRFAIQGGISFRHAGGVAAQHLAMTPCSTRWFNVVLTRFGHKNFYERTTRMAGSTLSAMDATDVEIAIWRSVRRMKTSTMLSDSVCV